MSEELLSALLDGECSPAEVEVLLAEIDRSPALKARWSRLCATRDALAGVAIRRKPVDLVAGVMSALDAEPDAVVHPNVVAMRARPVPIPAPVPAAAETAGVRRSQRRSRFAGLAVAASITAVVAIGGRNLLETPIDGGAPAATSVASVAPPAANLVRVSADGDIIGTLDNEPVASHWAQVDDETARRLNGYLLEHNSRTGSGMGGALGYARIAVRTADFRPGAGAR